MRYNIVCIFILYCLLAAIGVNGDGDPIATPILPYGIEPYAQSSTCRFEFNLVIKGGDLLDGAGSFSSAMTQTVNHQSVLVSQLQEGIQLSVFGEFSSSQTYSPIFFEFTTTKATTSYTLKDTLGKELSFTCEDVPNELDWFVSGTVTRLVNTSYVVSTNRFQNYIRVNDRFTRPLPNDFFQCQANDILCTFTYIKPQVYLVDYKYIGSGHYPATIPIKVPVSSISAFIENPLYRSNYSDAHDLQSVLFNNFVNLPDMGNVLYYKSNNLLFPSFNIDVTPLHLASSDTSRIIYFKSGGAPQSFLVQKSNTFKSIGSQTEIPKAIVTGMDLGYKQIDGYGIANIKLNFTRMSIYYDYLQEPFYFYYPFGITSIGTQGINMSFAISLPQTPKNIKINYGIPNYFPSSLTIDPALDTTPPALNGYGIHPLNDTTSILQLAMRDTESGVYYAKLQTSSSVFYVKSSNYKINTFYEIYVPFKNSTSFNLTIYDNAKNSKVYTNEMLHSLFKTPLPGQDVSSRVNSIVFDPPVNILVDQAPAKMWLYANISATQEIDTVKLKVYLSPLIPTPEVFGEYNGRSGLYQFPFTLPHRLMPGFLNYSIFINEQEVNSDSLIGKFGKNAELYVENKGTFDMMFPYVQNYTTTVNNGLLIWDLDVYDVTGIAKIIVGVAGQYDVRGKNYTFTPNGAPTSYLCKIEHTIFVDLCRNQTYFINYVYTEDILGNKGEYIKDASTSIHPFWKVESIQNRPIVKCHLTTDEVGPEITELNMEQTQSFPTPVVQVTFTASDQLPGIAKDYLPTCFLTGAENHIISSLAEIVKSDQSSVFYKCLINVPFGFGPYGLLSIYGLTDKHFNYNGYPTNSLNDANFAFRIKLTYSDIPFIESTSSLNISSEKLIINGINLFSSVVEVTSTYPDSVVAYVPQTSTSSSLIILNIVPAFEYTIIVKGVSLPARVSNSITLKGPLEKSSSSSSSSSISSSEGTLPPIIKQCSSDCGVSQKWGTCVNGVCVCVSPHSGIDCKSVIDTTPVITPNPSNPTVNVTIPGTSSGETPKFTSFIYVVALRELDNSNTVINNYVFNSNKWILVNEGSSSNNQVTTIQYKYVL